MVTEVTAEELLDKVGKTVEEYKEGLVESTSNYNTKLVGIKIPT
jgi:hypothetical protein